MITHLRHRTLVCCSALLAGLVMLGVVLLLLQEVGTTETVRVSSAEVSLAYARDHASTWTAIPFGTGSDRTFDVAFGDADGDGDLDLAVGSHGQNQICWNNGDGTFDCEDAFEGRATFDVDWGDIDGDGYLDLVVANQPGHPNWVCLNNGERTFTCTGFSTCTGGESSSCNIALADVDGDDDLDIALGIRWDQNLIHYNDGTGTFPVTTTVCSDYDYWTWTLDLEFGDVDNDDDPDLVVVGNGSGYVCVNDPTGIFTETRRLPYRPATPSVALGDADGDGDLDIAMGNGADDPIEIYLNDGHGYFPGALLVGPASDETLGLAWGDVDNDGDPDLAAGNFNQQNVIYLNDPVTGTNDITFTRKLLLGTDSSRTNSVTFGDVDGDGDLDLAVGNDGEQNVVYTNTLLPIVVTSRTDSGEGSLRQAMLDALPDDTITFDPEVFPPTNPMTITLLSALPEITQGGLTIDASNAGVVLDGHLTPLGTDGLRITSDGNVIKGSQITRFPDDGVVIMDGAKHNTIGGLAGADRNVISGNGDDGIYLTGVGTEGNSIEGNYIGVSASGMEALGNGDNGIYISEGAGDNVIGGDVSGAGNVISANGYKGVLIVSQNTSGNVISGNLIGTNARGDAPLGNTSDGIEIAGYAHHNRVGGTAPDERNILSGNGSNGIIIVGGAHHNSVLGNFIGTDRTGALDIDGQPGGGVDLASGAQYNIIGGSTAKERNIISGNGVDGIFIADPETQYNIIQGNYIGTDVSGTAAIPNTPWGLFILSETSHNLITDNLISGNTGHGLEITLSAFDNEIRENRIVLNGGAGIHFGEGASQHAVISNTITDNDLEGVWISDGAQGCTIGPGNMIAYNLHGVHVNGITTLNHAITANSIYSNAGEGVLLTNGGNGEFPGPAILTASWTQVLGAGPANARIELFSDNDGEGRDYEGFTVADELGNWDFSKPEGLKGPCFTSTATDADRNTSEFSQPICIGPMPTPTPTPTSTSSWTAMVYLNGDNNLDAWVRDAFQKLELAAGAPNVRIVALWDRLGDGNTARYLVQPDDNFFELADYVEGENRWSTWDECDPDPSECNMADYWTLYHFVTWARSTFPAEHYFLSIVDHGGGWGPSLEPGQHDYAFLGGMSWDDTSGGPPISTRRMGEAFRQFTNDGADRIDVVLYDACAMATLEDAYEIHRYADYLVASQNQSWSVFAYDRYLEDLGSVTDPRELAENIVTRYTDLLAGYPRTMSAINLGALNLSDGLAKQVNNLGVALRPLVAGRRDAMEQARVAAQKFDVNFDEVLEGDDYYVDLYDFAEGLKQRFPDQPDVQDAAEGVMRLIEQNGGGVMVEERHVSGFNWRNREMWDLEGAHGISIYVPSPVLETSWLVPLYSQDNLALAADTGWDEWVRKFSQESGGLPPTPIPPGERPGPLPLPRLYLPLILNAPSD